MNFKYDTDLLVLGPVAMLLVLALRRLVDLPERLPRWNRWLSWLWLPAALAFAYSATQLRRDTPLGEAYMLLVFTVILATLLRLFQYQPARTLLFGVLIIWLKWAVKVGLLLGNYQLRQPYADYFTMWGKLTTIAGIAAFTLAYTQKRTLRPKTPS
jgi:membrane protein required for beta-lactamase induction